MLAMIVVAATTAANALLLEQVLDDIFLNKDATKLLLLPLAVMGLAVIKAVASYFQETTMRGVGQRIMCDMQLQLYEHLLRADMAQFHQEGSGKLISRLTNDITVLRDALTNVTTGIVKEWSTLIFLVGVMFYQSTVLSLIALVAFPFGVLPILRMGKRMRKVSNDTQAQLGNITADLDEAFRAMAVIKAYGGEGYETGKARAAIERVYQLYIKGFRIKAASSPLMEMLTGLAVAGVIWYGGFEVINGHTTQGAFVSFLAATMMAYKPVKSIAGLNTSLQEGLAAGTRLFARLDEVATIQNAPDAVTLPRAEGRITLEEVGFRYQNDRPALESLSLTIEPGQFVALAGPSGGGKSTLIQLLLRFYDAQQGRILIDGQEVRGLTLESLRAQFGYVGQDTYLFDDSVAANIAYGDASPDRARVEQAATDAAADSFIRNLPQGYDTPIGPHGVTLSGGQRQRLAIARALYRNAPILLFDEATAALDTVSEQQIQQALERIRGTHTVIAVAHRLSTIRHADCIYVVEGGRVVESGTHAALLARNGAYARLVAHQGAEG
jgi:subfamily B ATP-binding cassette protein MsbA